MAKDLVMIVAEHCPHCDDAFALMHDIEEEHPEYNDVNIDVIDDGENPDETANLHYKYLPAFFIDGKNVHEGKVTREDLEWIYKEAES